MSFKAKKESCPILERKSWLVLLLAIFFMVKVIDGAKHVHQKKPATLTILSEDGDIVDCIDIYKQPALNHPLLKNHTIKMKPSFVPAMVGTNYSYNPVQQIWQKNGICPEGTIPIQRVRGTSDNLNGEFSECKVEVARLEMQKKRVKTKYLGATGTISAWNINVEINEWSLNSVSVFTDKDSFVETGWADENQNALWAKLQGELIGYWPMIFFENSYDVRRVNWGGSVCNMRPHGHHTATEMGSGAHAGGQYKKASFVREIQMILSRTKFTAPVYGFLSASCDQCYSVRRCLDFLDAPVPCIYYGGPGGRDCDLHCN